MTNHAEEFIEEYFSRLIKHHKSIFGTQKDASLARINFVDIHNQFLSFVHLVCQVDERFEDDFIRVCVDDIINLLQINNEQFDKSERFEKIYSDFLKTLTYVYEKDDFMNRLNKEFKLHNNKLKEILNTKFFYLDKYIWHKIKKSIPFKEFLKLKKLPNIGSTMAYLDMQKESKLHVVVDYSPFKIDAETKYKSSDIEYVKDILNHEKEDLEELLVYDENDPLEQLVRYKKRIPYFKDMSDENIRNVVSDVKFRRYNKNEVVIKEYEDDKDIFFLIEGGCDICLAKRSIGSIIPKSIFGEFSFITNRLRSATIQTTCSSVIISFKINLELFEDDPLLFPQLYKNISSELVKKFYSININYISM